MAHPAFDLQEMSQRDPGGPVQTCVARAEANLRLLLEVPDHYKVLFFQVGCCQTLLGLRCLYKFVPQLKTILRAGRGSCTVCGSPNEFVW